MAEFDSTLLIVVAFSCDVVGAGADFCFGSEHFGFHPCGGGGGGGGGWEPTAGIVGATGNFETWTGAEAWCGASIGLESEISQISFIA